MDATGNQSFSPGPGFRVLLALGCVLIVAGVLSAWLIPPWHEVWRLHKGIPAERVGTLLGIYFIGAGSSVIVISGIMKGVRRLIRLEATSNLDKTLWPPKLVGLCETVLYPTALLMGHPAFIAVWLGMKTAGSWKAWEVEKYEGRARFQHFLIGNAWSIGWGVGMYGAVLYWVMI